MIAQNLQKHVLGEGCHGLAFAEERLKSRIHLLRQCGEIGILAHIYKIPFFLDGGQYGQILQNIYVRVSILQQHILGELLFAAV